MMNRSFGLTLSLLCAGIGSFAADAAHGFGELPVGAVIRELSAHAQERQGQRSVVADPAEAKWLGLTNKEIGRALDVSPRTVETHRANLFAKLDAESLAQLIRRYAALVEDAA